MRSQAKLPVLVWGTLGGWSVGRRRLSRWEGAGGEPVKGQHGVPHTVPNGGKAGVERGAREPGGSGVSVVTSSVQR